MNLLVQRFENGDYEMLKNISRDNVTIKDKKTKKYYEIPLGEIENQFEIEWNVEQKNHNTAFIVLYSMTIVLLSIVNIYILIYNIPGAISTKQFIMGIVIYLPVFILLHESGHILALKHYGKQANKVGFKFNYIFPSFFVRMNDSYMMDKIEKFYVHSAGLMFSLLLNTIVFIIGIISKNYLFIYITTYIAFDIVMNSIPILNSDGYKICITLLGFNEKKRMSSGSKFVFMIKILNWIIVIFYTIWFIYSTF